MHESLHDIAAVAQASCRPGNDVLERHDAAIRGAQKRKKHAFKRKKFINLRDIPVIKEIRDDIRAITTGGDSAGSVMWMPHLALFPLLMPAKLVLRTFQACEERAAATTTIRRLRENKKQLSHLLIVESSAWQSARASLMGARAGAPDVFATTR